MMRKNGDVPELNTSSPLWYRECSGHLCGYISLFANLPNLPYRTDCAERAKQASCRIPQYVVDV